MSVYPGSLDSDATLYVAKDNLATKLNAAMSASDTGAVLFDPTGWVANMIATVDSEQMLVTALIGNVAIVTRAFGGTLAAAHAAQRPFSNFVDAAYQSSLKSAVIAVQTALGANLSNVQQTTSEYFVAADGQTNFSPSSFTPLSTSWVFLNGLKVRYGVSNDWFISGATVVFNYALSAGDVVECIL